MTTPELPIGRNTALLAGAMAVNSAVLQLSAAMTSITFVAVTGVEGLLGLGPAIFLTAQAVAALPAGRSMDRFGRRPVIALGFVLAALACVTVSAGARTSSGALAIAGFALLGASSGMVLLTRTAAGDMYPPERRARGIALVLFGSVFGAILGPTVFTPIFAGRELEAEQLAAPWFAAAALPLVALALVLAVRPDPKRIAELLRTHADETATGAAAPVRELVRRPGVARAILAAVASMAVMVSVMNLTGYVVVDHHHHEQHDVFPIIGAHVLGMFGLVLVIGPLIDRIGRTPALAGGLVVMGLSCLGLISFESVVATAVLLFGLGVGWNLSFVAATAQLADATAPWERGRLLGFNDLVSSFTGAALALGGGLVLDAFGVTALALGAAALVLVPVAWVGRGPRARPAAAPVR